MTAIRSRRAIRDHSSISRRARRSNAGRLLGASVVRFLIARQATPPHVTRANTTICAERNIAPGLTKRPVVSNCQASRNVRNSKKWSNMANASTSVTNIPDTIADDQVSTRAAWECLRPAKRTARKAETATHNAAIGEDTTANSAYLGLSIATRNSLCTTACKKNASGNRKKAIVVPLGSSRAFPCIGILPFVLVNFLAYRSACS